MAAIFDFFTGGDGYEATSPPRNTHTGPGFQKSAHHGHEVHNGSAYVTQKDLVDALGKLQAKFEERLNAERKKRVARLEDIANSMAKRLATFEEDLKTRPTPSASAIVDGAKGTSTPSPADVERLAQTLAQREPRLAAIVGEGNNDDARSVVSMRSDASHISEAGSKAMMIEELKAKVERLEKGSKKLVAAAAEALAGRRAEDGSNPLGDEASAVGGPLLSNRSALSETGLSRSAEAAALRPRVDALESQMTSLNRKTSDMEQVVIKVRTLEDTLDNRIKTTVSSELRNKGLDRPPNISTGLR